MAETVYLTASNRENTRHRHIVRAERIRAGDGAAVDHITETYLLCGERCVDSMKFSNPWNEYRKRPVMEYCEMCMDRLAEIRMGNEVTA